MYSYLWRCGESPNLRILIVKAPTVQEARVKAEAHNPGFIDGDVLSQPPFSSNEVPV